MARRKKDPLEDDIKPPASPDVEQLTNRGLDRSEVMGSWLTAGARWSWRTLLVLALAFVVLWLLSKVSMAVVPLMFALLLTSVLWKPVGWMERRGMPRVLAAILALLATFAVIAGIITAMAPMVAEQSGQLADKTVQSLEKLQRWSSGPPLNIKDEQITKTVETVSKKLQERAGDIANGVFLGLSTLGSILFNSILVLMMSVFMLKDGPKFLPTVRRVVGREAGRHITECGTRIWHTISGYVRTQAIVSAVDAVFIGAGLLFTGTPLWPVLALITFLAGFIPMVGAVAAGALAVGVALIAKGPIVALIVLGVVIAVQQLEGNVLTPWLQGQAMELHALIVLVAVTIGGALFGIPGAFFAVPVAAAVVVILRYINEQIDLTTGDIEPAEISPVTVQGRKLLEEAEERRARALQHAPAAALPDEAREESSQHPPFWARVKAVFFP